MLKLLIHVCQVLVDQILYVVLMKIELYAHVSQECLVHHQIVAQNV